MCAAPFFSTEYCLADGDSLALGSDVLVAGGEHDAGGYAEWVAQVRGAGDHAQRVLHREGFAVEQDGPQALDAFYAAAARAGGSVPARHARTWP